VYLIWIEALFYGFKREKTIQIQFYANRFILGETYTGEDLKPHPYGVLYRSFEGVNKKEGSKGNLGFL
jgi:hypothetical protein